VIGGLLFVISIAYYATFVIPSTSLSLRFTQGKLLVPDEGIKLRVSSIKTLF